jgi:hypothetical protein
MAWAGGAASKKRATGDVWASEAMSDTEPKEYPFPKNPAETEYRIFPPELEQDKHVWFHATTIAKFELIKAEGFKITRENGLDSVSFAETSTTALDHAMRKSLDEPAEYCIIAARYESLERKGLKVNASDLHDYTLDPQPSIIGVSRIPASYSHV